MKVDKAKNEEAKAYWRAELEKLLPKLPPSVVNGSYNSVVQWKDDKARAQKAFNNPKATAESLQAAVFSLERWK